MQNRLTQASKNVTLMEGLTRLWSTKKASEMVTLKVLYVCYLFQLETHQKMTLSEGYSVVRVKVIFCIPERFHAHLFNPGIDVPDHLAYVEWYSPLDT
jgi:hypothetical protein